MVFILFLGYNNAFIPRYNTDSPNKLYQSKLDNVGQVRYIGNSYPTLRNNIVGSEGVYHYSIIRGIIRRDYKNATPINTDYIKRAKKDITKVSLNMLTFDVFKPKEYFVIVL